MVGDPIELYSGDDSSTDDPGSNTGHETSSTTTPTCAVSPVSSNSNEGKIEITEIGGEDTGGPVAAALNLEEQQDSLWLDINHFPKSNLGVEDGAAEDKYQKIKNIEDNSGSHNAKDGQAEDRSREMDHHANMAEDGPRDEDEVGHGGEDAIPDPEMDGIEVYSDGSHSKDSHVAGVGGDVEGLHYLHASFISELTLQF